MKKLALMAAVLVPVSVSAECYLRSTTINEMNSKVERTADVQKEIASIAGQKQCTVTFRVMIDGAWYTALGRARDHSASNETQLCTRAMDTGRARVLQDIKGSEMAMTQELVCTDQDIPKYRPVQVGQVIRESEVAPHWDPNMRQSFPYRGMECRWFMENVATGVGGLTHNMGIMCRTRFNEWYVLEKWRLGG